jgi:hypothetical protein
MGGGKRLGSTDSRNQLAATDSSKGVVVAPTLKVWAARGLRHWRHGRSTNLFRRLLPRL